MWDATQKKELWSVKATRIRDNGALPMVFSPDGKLFAVETPPRVISIREALTGKVVRQFKGNDSVYNSLCISPDNLIVAGWDGSLHLWDMENGRKRSTISAVRGWVNVFFAPDSKTFATGGPNNAHSVLLWETATGKPIEPFPGHASPVSSVSFSPDGKIAATSSCMRGDPVIRLWDPQTGRLLRSIEIPNGEGAHAVAFSPDGRTLASSGWGWSPDQTAVRLWDVGIGRIRNVLTGHEGRCTCVLFSSDGKRLVSGDDHDNRMGEYEGRLFIRDAGSGQKIREIRGTRGAIQRVLFTRDGRQVVAAADGVHIYDVVTGKVVGEPLQPPNRVWGLDLSPDGQVLATTDQPGRVRLWELASHREISLMVPEGKGNDITFAPDGRTLAIASTHGDVALHHWPSGKILKRLSGDADVGSRVVFSPDGRRLATAGNDESSVLIWDVAGVVNRPFPAVARPSAADLKGWWAELLEPSPDKAYKAIWRFAATPEQALPYLASAIRPIKSSEPAVVARWIKELDSDEFKIREQASFELKQLGDTVVDALRQAKKGNVSIEQAKRIDELLEELAGPIPSPEQLRALRRWRSWSTLDRRPES